MPKGYMPEIRNDYWKLRKDERERLWAKLLSDGNEENTLNKIRRNNSLPLEESTGVKEGGGIVYPRFNANASLLAQSSPDYHGPRGSRPSFASAFNLLHLSGMGRRDTVLWGIKLSRAAGGIDEFLLDRKITASNMKYAPDGVEFSHDDIRNGVYVPNRIDAPVARALGVVYGDGNISGNLLLTTAGENLEFYESVVRKVFEEAFNFFSDQNINSYRNASKFTGNEYASVHLTYSSKALRSYLENHIGFPVGREDRRNADLSRKIKDLSDDLRDEFLRYFLASTVAFDDEKGLTRISDVSKKVLYDIRDLIDGKITKKSMTVRQRASDDTLTLSLSTVPSMELWAQGLLGENPRIKRKIEGYLKDGKPGFRARNYIADHYGIAL
ncbi:MAG: hypothetical protein V1731_02800 [Candidatus Aenigmatarchaeota archaeon]